MQVLYGRCSVKISSAFSILFSLPLPKKKKKGNKENMGSKGKGKSAYVPSMRSSFRSEIPT